MLSLPLTLFCNAPPPNAVLLDIFPPPLPSVRPLTPISLVQFVGPPSLVSPFTYNLEFMDTSSSTNNLEFMVTPPPTDKLEFMVTPPKTDNLEFMETSPPTDNLVFMETSLVTASLYSTRTSPLNELLPTPPIMAD